MTLGWQASTDPNVVGYNIYYGTSSGNYTSEVTVGNATSITLNGLVPGTTYYLAATTFDSQNLQSDFSPEITYTVPAVVTNPSANAATLTPVASLVGGQFSLNVAGVANGQYIIQASSDMVSWTSVATNTVPFTFMDPNAGQYKQRFYRANYVSQ